MARPIRNRSTTRNAKPEAEKLEAEELDTEELETETGEEQQPEEADDKPEVATGEADSEDSAQDKEEDSEAAEKAPEAGDEDSVPNAAAPTVDLDPPPSDGEVVSSFDELTKFEKNGVWTKNVYLVQNAVNSHRKTYVLIGIAGRPARY